MPDVQKPDEYFVAKPKGFPFFALSEREIVCVSQRPDQQQAFEAGCEKLLPR